MPQTDYRATLTRVSANPKTGPMPVSITTRATCPTSCPLLGEKGCYAHFSPLGWAWNKVTNGRFGTDWKAFCDAVRALPKGILWRHNQAGDLPGKGDLIDRKALLMLTDASKGKRGFTYTHKPVLGTGAIAKKNRFDVSETNALTDFVVNLSADNLAEADAMADLGIGPVVTVQDTPHGVRTNQRTPKGRTVVTCPATYREDVTCLSCGICAVRQRKAIIGFPAHGTKAKDVRAIAKGKDVP